MQSSRIRVHEVRRSHPISSILETQAGPAKARHAARIPDARIGIRALAIRYIDFLLERHLAHEGLRFLEGRGPWSGTVRWSCSRRK